MAKGQGSRYSIDEKLRLLEEYDRLIYQGLSASKAARTLGIHPQTIAVWRARHKQGVNLIQRSLDPELVVKATAERVNGIVDDTLTVLELAITRAKEGLTEKKAIFSKGEYVGEEPATTARDAAYIVDRLANVYMDLTQGRRGQTPINITLHQQKIEAEVANILSEATPEQLAQLALSPVVEGEIVED